MPFHYHTKVAAVCGFCLLTLLPVVLGGPERIQPGDTRADVLQELGSSFSQMKFGAFETLTYKDGTSVSLQNGQVTEVRPGKQIVTDFRTNASSHHVSAAAPNTDRSPDRPETTRLIQKPASTPLQVEPKPPVSKPVADAPVPEKKPSPSVAQLPSHPIQAVAQPGRPATARLSTNLAPFSISRTTGRSPVVLSFTGGSGKTLNPVRALSLFYWVARGLAVLFLGLMVGLYLFTSYCCGRICQKVGQQPGVLIWIPVAQFIPLLRVAQLPPWTLILVIVPLANIALLFTLWAKICIALGKNPWLVVLLLVPLANLGLVAYLAFCPAPPQPQPPADSASDTTPQPEAVAV